MTDEIPSNVVITDFFSGGPKFYCLSGFYSDTSNDYNVFKMKGITMNRACEKIFDKDGFKKLVLQEVHELRSPFSSMKRCVRSGRIHNSFCQKVTKTTSNKRVFPLKLVVLFLMDIVVLNLDFFLKKETVC